MAWDAMAPAGGVRPPDEVGADSEIADVGGVGVIVDSKEVAIF